MDGSRRYVIQERGRKEDVKRRREEKRREMEKDKDYIEAIAVIKELEDQVEYLNDKSIFKKVIK